MPHTYEDLFENNRRWVARRTAEDPQHFERLAAGQSPDFLFIGCSDSRVDASEMTGTRTGEMFIHRNIANLVPSFQPDGGLHGTSAAVEYAVNGLKVAHIVVLGHSQCGGVKGCYDMCSGRAPELDEATSFVGRWMDILRPGFEALPSGGDAERIQALEKEAVMVSIGNLMTFPFVRQAVEDGRLTLHGLWHDIGEGTLEAWDEGRREFLAV